VSSLARRHPRLQLAKASTRVVWGLLVIVMGCEGEANTAPPPPVEEQPSIPALPGAAEAFGMPIEELRRAVGAARARMRSEGDDAARVRVALEGAPLARILALREPDGAGLEAARELLRSASEGEPVECCLAALELARLEARDAVDLPAAYVMAYGTARRFAGRQGAEACVTEARRMVRALDAHRPDARVLAALGAEQDRRLAAAAPLEAWAEERADRRGPPAVLREVVVYGGGPDPAVAQDGVVRVVLHFDRVAGFSRGEIDATADAPRRLFLDFERARVAPSVAQRIGVGAAGLSRVRVGRTGTTVRVAFDLDGGAAAHVFLLSDPYRVFVDLDRAPSRAQRLAVAEPSGRRRTILLDPGHGGDDFGARFDGLKESHLTLDITRRVTRLLQKRLPGAKVLMTRHGDDFVSLEQRTAMANAAEADLFVSVHLNAADGPVQRGGVSTFVLDVTNDEQALRLAARENGTTPQQVTELQRILASLHRRDQSEGSRRLAALVHDALLSRARKIVPGLPDRGVRQAMFYVLVGARMPAVLVEASFMTDPVEAQMLRTDRYRQALADGIAEGILRYVQD
jgi:N-acetylmuramoyl-L-alanine amidase